MIFTTGGRALGKTEAAKLKKKAALFLEYINISSDTIVKMNHNIDEIPECQIGSYYLYDILVLFLNNNK
jgi:hypothetical protein